MKPNASIEGLAWRRKIAGPVGPQGNGTAAHSIICFHVDDVMAKAIDAGVTWYLLLAFSDYGFIGREKLKIHLWTCMDD